MHRWSESTDAETQHKETVKDSQRSRYAWSVRRHSLYSIPGYGHIEVSRKLFDFGFGGRDAPQAPLLPWGGERPPDPLAVMCGNMKHDWRGTCRPITLTCKTSIVVIATTFTLFKASANETKKDGAACEGFGGRQAPQFQNEIFPWWRNIPILNSEESRQRHMYQSTQYSFCMRITLDGELTKARVSNTYA